MSTHDMPLLAIAEALKISKSKLQYYKDLNIIRPVTEFPKSKRLGYDMQEVSRILKKVKELQKQGHTLKEIGAKKLA